MKHNSIAEEITRIVNDSIAKNAEIRLLKINNEMLMRIFDALDEVVYVCNMDTYEILYANKAAKEIMGENEGEPCYKSLQNLDHPCDFCKNSELKENYKAIKWPHTNLKDGKKYKVIDMMIPWENGIKATAKFEIAIKNE